MAEHDYDSLVQEGCYLHQDRRGGAKTENAGKGSDMVNSPSHYCFGSIECIDAIRACLSDEEFRGFCKGNAIKYIWRERYKGGDESLAKAGWYINRGNGRKA